MQLERKIMQTVYRLNASELDNHFLESLKTLFANKEIEIIINELDETTYLLSNEANRKRLLEAVEAVKYNENLIELDPEQLQ
jgi:antitoxin YefM